MLSPEDQRLLCDAAQSALARDRMRVCLKVFGCRVEDVTDEELDVAVRIIWGNDEEAVAGDRRAGAGGNCARECVGGACRAGYVGDTSGCDLSDACGIDPGE